MVAKMKRLRDGSLLFLFLFASMVIFPVSAHAVGGGFEVPEINEDFREIKEGPAPDKGTPTAETGEGKGFPDRAADGISGFFNQLKSGVQKAWDSAIMATKNVARQAWDWVTSTAGKITGGMMLVVTALAGLFGKFGRQIQSTVQRAYSSLKQRMQNRLYPNGTLKDRKVTDRELAIAAMASKGGTVGQKTVDKPGKDWEAVSGLREELPYGLQADMFVNPRTNEMMIAFRDTETFPGKTGKGAAGFDQDAVNAQVIAARKYLQEKIFSEEKYRHYDKILTGHALGGYVAADCAARYKIPAVTFNVPKLPNVSEKTLLGALGGSKGAVGMAPMGNYAVKITEGSRAAKVVKESTGAYDKLIRNYRFPETSGNDSGGRFGKKGTPLFEFFGKVKGNLVPR